LAEKGHFKLQLRPKEKFPWEQKKKEREKGKEEKCEFHMKTKEFSSPFLFYGFMDSQVAPVTKQSISGLKSHPRSSLRSPICIWQRSVSPTPTLNETLSSSHLLYLSFLGKTKFFTVPSGSFTLRRASSTEPSSPLLSTASSGAKVVHSQGLKSV